MRVISYPFCDRSKSEFVPPGFANWAPRDIWRPSKSVYKFDNRTLLIVGCTALVLTGLIGVLSAIFLAWREDARRRQLVAVSEVTRDWQPTWKINAVTDGG